jgi:glycosyltransferase involved in cell wall biosynthesis
VRYASELTPLLKKYCTEILFITPKGVRQKKLAEKLGAFEYGNFKGYLWEQVELPILLKKLGNPLLFNLSNTGPVFYKNQVTVIHDIAFIKNPGWYSRRAALAFKIVISRSAKISKQIITLSEFTKCELIRHLKIHPEKVKVINGAAPQRIIDLSEKEYENRYGEYILTVSSLQPRKNISGLIDSFNKLQDKNLKLVIAGSEDRKIFSDPLLYSSGNQNIIFTGYISDKELTGLYKNAKLFVYPSLYEGFGFPPLEALVCGTPVLVSNTSSLPETCKSNADYFNPYDQHSLIRELKKILNSDTNKDNKKGFIDRMSYSWENSAHTIIYMLKNINDYHINSFESDRELVL